MYLSLSDTFYVTLSDGGKLAYEIHGSDHLGNGKQPIILIGGVSNVKIDWDRLIPGLTLKRTEKNDKITLELMARDLLALLTYLGWKEVDIIGFSMGGVVAQQLLLLPFHAEDPTPLPFRVHHVLLTGTFCSPIKNPFQPPIVKFEAAAPGQGLSVEQRKEMARPMLDASLGARWVAKPENKERYDAWLDRMIIGRPLRTIMKQRAALATINYTDQLGLIDPSIKILVIHGIDDEVVPFSHGEEILRSSPHACMVTIGSGRGQVPSYAFGHIWYEYFAVDVWIGVIESFVDDEATSARL
ncbi:Alpha/Beta hydrolase protein [Hysterangium stoloniferum]|nr:Alpha/Beta hydrolase protein [Hysterangium stoloniferum]